jgi:hypothetical protein
MPSGEPVWELTVILAVPVQVRAASQAEAFEQARELVAEMVHQGDFEVDCIEVHSVSKSTN